MEKNDISRLLQRYLSSREGGKDAYFDANEVDDLLDSFEESEDLTYYDEVLALGLRLHPGNPDLQVRLCKSFVFNEDYDSALALINTIAEPENQDLDLLRMECYVMQNSYGKVIEYTEKLMADKCEYLETVFEYVAPLLSDADMNKEAHDYIDRGLMLFPDNLILKDELCYTLELEGDIQSAIKVCNELIDKNPYSNDYWFTLGRLNSICGEYEKAIEAFDFALTCDDSDEELKILKAYCLFMNENYEKAIEVYNEIATTDEIQTRVTPLLAECYVKMEDYEKAYGLLHKYLNQRKGTIDDSSSYINYIRCCVETEREKEASEALQKAVKLFPKNFRILSLQALTYLENGEEEKAIEVTGRLFEAIDNCKNKHLEDFNQLFRAGQFLFMKGEIDKALQYYEKVYEAHPDTPFIHLHMAIAYLAKGDLERFSKHYLQTDPEEFAEYMKEASFSDDYIDIPNSNHIPPENLTKEFLKNKDNNN